MAKKKIGVLLSGCGVYDGAEIHESVLTLLALDKAGAEYVCMAPNVQQHHVVDHLTGNEMNETRNVLTEAARIARGDIKDLAEVTADQLDGLAIPGGFGAAKNLTTWAFSGPDGEINAEVKRIINEMVAAGKPIAAMCMGPTVVAKALQGSTTHATLTVGSTEAASPYDIAAVSGGMEAAGAVSEMHTVDEIAIDTEHKIVTAPCYMMEASISEMNAGIEKAVAQLMKWS